MKNRKLLNIIYVLFIIIIVCFFYMYKYKDTIIDEKIYNKTWYSYDTTTGYYDTFNITDNNLVYNKSENVDDSYSSCSSYNYDKKSKSFVLDCDKEISIDEITDNRLVLVIDEKKKVFYDNINDTLNTEFNSYYSKSISEFKNDMNRVKELIKIEQNEIKSMVINNDYSKFIFIGDKCSSIECSISLDVIEKWITNTENIYFVDSNQLDNTTLFDLNNIDEKFNLDINYYNGVYPLVVITNNGEILDMYYIRCNGFNCEKYKNNEF